MANAHGKMDYHNVFPVLDDECVNKRAVRMLIAHFPEQTFIPYCFLSATLLMTTEYSDSH
jgi:hypothetical protein